MFQFLADTQYANILQLIKPMGICWYITTHSANYWNADFLPVIKLIPGMLIFHNSFRQYAYMLIFFFHYLTNYRDHWLTPELE